MATCVEEVLRGDSKGRKGPEAMKMSGSESASGNAPTPNQDASASSQGAFNSLSAQSSHLGVTGAQIEWEETRKEDEMSDQPKPDSMAEICECGEPRQCHGLFQDIKDHEFKPPKTASVAGIVQRAKQEIKDLFAVNSGDYTPTHAEKQNVDVMLEEVVTRSCEEVEAIWYDRLAKMQKIHERELQELRERLEEGDSRILSYITARESDKNFWQSKLQQAEADRRRLAKATKVLLGWMKYVRLPCGQYSVKPLERAEAEASAAIDEAIK
jgi:hypothetical protein